MRKKNKGFTIIEILFAFALLAAGLTGVVLIMSEGQSQNSVSRMHTVAVSLAKERMENIRNLPYASINTVPLTPFTPPYVDYSYQVNVNTIGALPGQVKDVVVLISYNSGKGATASVSLETYIPNY
ncbi:MAG: prepilin-type N-terminal cleavage/methylation domain-containing protein [bacterium]|nr:prepilin-type N-terminal cleavage/methylation domain-containing protein [bacterium]